MKKLLILLLFAGFSYQSMGWGQIGHRTIGKIASEHLDRKTRKALAEIMGHESLAVASTWMDEVRADDSYDHMADWHWVTIPEGESYDTAEKNPNGDIIATIQRIIQELKTNKDTMPVAQQREYIRILTHLVGDIHQPLHVGTGLDRGGNDAKVTWFWDTDTNLHSVWDSRIIDSKQYSYTELAQVVDHTRNNVIQDWQADTVLQWAAESMSYRELIYAVPDDENLAYDYVYATWDTVKLRLHQAGIRLAGVLNDIYG